MTTSTSGRSETAFTLQYPFLGTDSHQPHQSLQTKCRRGDLLEYGAGYNTGHSQHSFKDHSIDDLPDERRSPRSLEQDKSEGKPEWRGWGFEPNDDNEIEAEANPVEEQEWRGWGVNPTHDSRPHDGDETALVNRDGPW
jgi:hypothetical protein